MKVKELIKILNNYDKETEVCSGYISSAGTWLHTDIIVKESNPIGDRDTEGQLLLWIGFSSEG